MKVSAQTPILTPISTPILNFLGNDKKPAKEELALNKAALEAKPVLWANIQGYLPKKTVSQHIDFEPAEDIEQAKNFARDSLGITFFTLKNLDCANYINEGLTRYYNNSSDKSIIITNCMPSYRYPAALTGDLLEFSPEIEEILNSAKERFKTKKGFELLSSKDLAKFSNLTESQMKYLDCFKNGTYDELSLKEKIGYMMFLRSICRDEIPLTEDGKLSLPDGGDFWIINHEIGHAIHKKNIGIAEYKKMGKGFTIGENSIEDLVQRFKDIEPDWKVTQKISDYATRSPVEFVAEVYACLLNGYKFDDDVMSLYEKYGGPKIT